eukprot:TRINITY_DN976_c0_g1_i7.p3 TRINITY_DN976_c0_g1~~TRINITY_DN976_c0_g1_i7.p3  ORF type:complete len:151 (-),score=4.44 TRINITY_DN976_c0_g1_i7:81-533(-)
MKQQGKRQAEITTAKWTDADPSLDVRLGVTYSEIVRAQAGKLTSEARSQQRTRFYSLNWKYVRRRVQYGLELDTSPMLQSQGWSPTLDSPSGASWNESPPLENIERFFNSRPNSNTICSVQNQQISFFAKQKIMISICDRKDHFLRSKKQ